MATVDRKLTKEETAKALGIDVKTLNRWLRKSYFPGPAIVEGGVKRWTMRQVERHIDNDTPV